MSYQEAQANHDRHSALINALAQHAQEQQARQAYLGTERLTLRVRQTSHGLAVGNVVRHNGTAWIKAQADTAANAAATAVVEQVIGDRFRLVLAGRIRGLSGLTAGSIHYLHAATAGALTTTAPALAVPILRALTTTEAVVLMQMGVSTTPTFPSDILAGSATISEGGSLALTPASSIPYGRRVDIHIASDRAYAGYQSSHTHHVSFIQPSSGGTLTQKWASASTSWSSAFQAAGGNAGQETYFTGSSTLTSALTISLTTDGTGYSAISIDITGPGGTYATAGDLFAVARW